MDHQHAWDELMEAARRALRGAPPALATDPICQDRLRHVSIPRELNAAGSRCPVCHPRRGRHIELAISDRLLGDAMRLTSRAARAAQN
ncbi:MAG: hypothetical protein E6I08_03030 [Chloroflexi bacterium]|nr:MAG: hypothetical protein E6I08_03030 [Chloroflexota bacterium]